MLGTGTRPSVLGNWLPCVYFLGGIRFRPTITFIAVDLGAGQCGACRAFRIRFVYPLDVNYGLHQSFAGFSHIGLPVKCASKLMARSVTASSLEQSGSNRRT